jgi:hypothetical protein
VFGDMHAGDEIAVRDEVQPGAEVLVREAPSS